MNSSVVGCQKNKPEQTSMKAKSLLWLLTTVLLTTVPVIEAQQPKKVPLIGYLSTRDSASDSARSEAVRQGLRELGYIEEQNITIEYRFAEGKRERFAELAGELVRLKVDIIVAAGGDLLIRPVMNATQTIPIVMTGGGADPVKEASLKASPAQAATSQALQTLS
jgi:ABC-type uncharacterized transport system substrate-binding protein